MKDRQKAEIAKQAIALKALDGGQKTQGGIILPNGAAVTEFGKPGGMQPGPSDVAFGFVLFKHKRNARLRTPIKKR